MFRCIMYVLRYKSAGAYLYFGGSKKANRRSIAEKETLRPFQWKVGKCATLIIMGTRYFVPISSDAKQIQRMSASVVRGGGGRHRPIRLFVPISEAGIVWTGRIQGVVVDASIRKL